MRGTLWLGTCVLLLGAVSCSDDNGVTPDKGVPDGASDAAMDAKIDAVVDGTLDTPDPGNCGPVTTQSGPVQGYTSATKKSCSFKGIPFAKPPTGPLRWKPPEKPVAWTTTLEAHTYGDACPQHDNGYIKWKGERDFNEDCLTLNVWTPDVKPAKPAPVLVWIHKGYWNQSGSSITAWTDGTNLAEMEGLVVVSFHYRLRALGFLAHPALGADSGNYGFLDQVHALEWIRDNVAAFGGDPTNVTIMGGGSQGAEMVNVHLVSDKSKGLFQRAIIHSGKGGRNQYPKGLFAFGPYMSRADAEAQGKKLAAAPKVQCDTAADVADCLRKADPKDLNGALPSFTFEPAVGADAFWAPIVEPGGVLEDLPLELIKAGKLTNKVPVLLGANRHELASTTNPFQKLPDQQITDRLKLLFGDTDGTAILNKYPLATEPQIGTACESKCAALSNMMSDYYFICPARRTARALAAAGVDTFLYHFAYPHYPTIDGPSHGSLKIYVFYTPQTTSPPPGAPHWLPWPFAPDEDTMAKEIMVYWARFARTGDPNGGSSVAWPKYDETKDEHLELNATFKPGSKLRESYCDFWDGLLALP